MYKKNFNEWAKAKPEIDAVSVLPSVHEREIWWCSIGVNIGFEEDGKNETFERPVLVLKKYSKELCFVTPLTSKKHEGEYYFEISENSFAILSQAKPLSTRRMLRYINKIGDKKFINLLDKFCLSLFNKGEIPPKRDFSGA